MNTKNLSYEEVTRMLFSASPETRDAALEAAAAVLNGGGQAAQPAAGPRLSLKQAARMLGKSAPTLHRLGVNRHCGLAWAGGRRTYTLEEIEKYLTGSKASEYRTAWRARRKTWKN